jgi:hypothetical protein
MTINTLADRYAAAKKVLDDQEAIVKGLKAEIVALGVEEVEGARNFVIVGLRERNTLDTKAVLAKLGALWVKANTKSTVYENLTIKAKPVKKLVGEAIEELQQAAGF